MRVVLRSGYRVSVLASQLGAGPQAGLSDGVRAEIDGAALGGGLGGVSGVQRLLAQDPLVQRLHRRTGVDAEILGEVHLQSPIGVEGVRLPLGDVVGGDQLGPQRFPEGMFGAKQLQARDHGVGTSARDLGFGEADLGHHFDLGQRGGKRIDESEFA